jgi:hypothetical protein
MRPDTLIVICESIDGCASTSLLYSSKLMKPEEERVERRCMRESTRGVYERSVCEREYAKESI